MKHPFLSAMTCVVIAGCSPEGCQSDKIVFDCAAVVKTLDGSASDGDGNMDTYSLNNNKLVARDGGSAASSDNSNPNDCKSLAGEARTELSQQATSAANAMTNNKVQSQLVVEGSPTARFVFMGSVSVALNGGTANYSLQARIMDKDNQYYGNSNFALNYRFSDDGDSISVHRNGAKMQRMGKGAEIKINDTMDLQQRVALTAGAYFILFEMNMNTTVDNANREAGDAFIKGNGTVSIIN